VALERDRDGEVADAIAAIRPIHPDQADRRFAVAIRAQLGGHPTPTSASARAARSRAIATTSLTARRISEPRSAASAASSTGTSARRERPLTKTQYRNPNRASYSSFRRPSSAIASVVSRSEALSRCLGADTVVG